MDKSKAILKSILDYGQFPDYDLMWCDPPWGEGYVKFFNNMMKKQVGYSRSQTIGALIKKIGALASKDKLLVVEYSIKESDFVVNVLTKMGHKHTGVIRGIYGSKNYPFNMLIFNKEVDLGVGGNKDVYYVNNLLKYYERGSVVFDPFAGIGHTAKIFMKNGFNYIGSEYNKARFVRLRNVIGKLSKKL